MVSDHSTVSSGSLGVGAAVVVVVAFVVVVVVVTGLVCASVVGAGT